MQIAHTIDQTRKIIRTTRQSGKVIGLVPTMGALHEGHLSLIRQCRRECDFVVVSIFVNPTQFGPGEDLAGYPRTFADDCQHCKAAATDLVFAPSDKEIYPRDNLSWVTVDKLTRHLCGKSRPIHFRGVCTVVSKLFNIIQPDIAYFGQKDAQQLAVIRRMTEDLNFPVEIRGCQTIRESDGLAMSSRNKYLTPQQRRQAVSLVQALDMAADMIGKGCVSTREIIAAMRDYIQQQPEARIDYISIVDNELLQPVDSIQSRVLIALAVYFGQARLIDNIVVDPPGGKN